MDHEVVKDRLYLRVIANGIIAGRLPQGEGEHCFSVDDSLVYFPFFLDYGPLSLGCLYKFCQLLNNKLTDKQLYGRRIILCSSSKMAARANAVYLLAAHSMLCLGRSPEEAMRPFLRIAPPLSPWHDASPTVDTFHLTTLDVLRGISKAVAFKFFDMDAFDIGEYEHYEKVEAGDMNWIAQGRFLAFAGPHDTRTAPVEGYHCTSVEDLLPYFKSRGVTTVIRLNKKYYNERRFTTVGIGHHDLYYLDGSNPPDHILQRFLQIVESTSGAIAVHCKAGLGRTGTCIGAYMMKHYRMSAREVIGWMRVCRPGSVIGPQQQFLEEIQQRMWDEGDYFRSVRSLPPPAPGSSLLLFNPSDARTPALSGGAGAMPASSQGGAAVILTPRSPPNPAHSDTRFVETLVRNTHPDTAAPNIHAMTSRCSLCSSIAASAVRRQVDERPAAVSYSSYGTPGKVGTVALPVSPAAVRARPGGHAADLAPAIHRPLASPATSPIAFAANGSLQRRVGQSTIGVPSSLSLSALGTYSSVPSGSPAHTGSMSQPTSTAAGGMTASLRAVAAAGFVGGYPTPSLLASSTPAKLSGPLGGQGDLLRSAKARNSPGSPMIGPAALAASNPASRIVANAAHAYRVTAASSGR